MMIKYFAFLFTSIIFLLLSSASKSFCILNLKFLLFTFTLSIFFDFIVFFNDSLTISTSGNSGIYYYITLTKLYYDRKFTTRPKVHSRCIQ